MSDKSIGDLYVDVKANLDTLNRDFKKLEGKVKGEGKKTSQDFSNTWKTSLLKVTAAFTVLAGAVRFFTDAVKLSIKQAQAVKQVEQAVRQTGRAAGYSSKQLEGMASSLQKVTGVGDEDILTNVTKQLLTFTAISGKAFERAQVAVLDLNAVIANGETSSLTTQAIQLGKALENPTQGISALTRSGITFTEQQKEQIKALQESGKLFEAQSIILDEIEAKYGGQAKALADANVGLKQMSASFGDMMERAGAVLLPTIGKLAKAFTWLFDSVFADGETATQKERVQLNLLASEIMNTNDNQEERNKLISELQTQYPGFLKNMEAEKITNKDIAVELKRTNEQMIQKILLEKKDLELQKKLITAADQLDRLDAVETSVREQYLSKFDNADMSKSVKEMAKELDSTWSSKIFGSSVPWENQYDIAKKNYDDALKKSGELRKRYDEMASKILGNDEPVSGSGGTKTVSSVPDTDTSASGTRLTAGLDENLKIQNELYTLDADRYVIQQDRKYDYSVETATKISEQWVNWQNSTLAVYDSMTAGFMEMFADMEKIETSSNNALVRGFVAMANAFISQVQRMLAQWLAFKAIVAIGNLLSPGAGTALGTFMKPGAHHGGTFTNHGGSISKAPSFATGTDNFIVPQGYPNDSYPINVESGEKVSVTPASGVNKQDRILFNINESIQAMNMNLLRSGNNTDLNIGIGGAVQGRDLKLSYDRQSKFDKRMR